MSEEWTGGSERAPARGGIPKWLWFCGGGCALLLLLGVLGAILAGRFLQRAMDPDRQWERLAQVLPHDEADRPAGTIFGLPIPFQPVEFWVLQQPALELQLVVLSVGGDESDETRREVFQQHAAGATEEGEVEIQGRSFPVVRYATDPETRGEQEEPGGIMDQIRRSARQHEDAATAVVDLTPPDGDDLLLLIFTRLPFGADAGDGDPVAMHRRIEDEEIRQFLRPFRIGEQR